MVPLNLEHFRLILFPNNQWTFGFVASAWERDEASGGRNCQKREGGSDIFAKGIGGAGEGDGPVKRVRAVWGHTAYSGEGGEFVGGRRPAGTGLCVIELVGLGGGRLGDS